MHKYNQKTLTFSQIIESLCDRALPSLQRRETTRHPRSVSVIVQPLNEDFLPDGEPCWVMTRDVSLGGLGFVNVRPTASEYVRVRLLDHDAAAVCRVSHSTLIDGDLPLFLTGVAFLDGEAETAA